MSVHLDYTSHSVVWVCSDCHTRGIALDRGEAWRAGATHQHHRHPESRQAYHQAHRWA